MPWRSVVAFVRYESRREEPLIDLRFFRSAPFSGATLIAVCAFAALGGFLFLNTLYLQEVRGLFAAARGPVHAADGGDDRPCSRRSPAGWSAPAGPGAAAGRRRGDAAWAPCR